ncbi:pectate lyase family protein [Paracoccus sediminicola]|uniref:pectate lyase family protein n=1 Tax=Paracoccus sediminicola TaxID=3017783 RepID=UPI0022F104B4|nr:hypothetical protein [Paracoccus sediminicola]WBU56498.1 hypothetical protein PAF18_13625 [Paracoccus sediminicola]
MGITKRAGVLTRHFRRVAGSFALFFSATCLPAAAQQDNIAFPGAIGYGSAASGWRGGEVIAVTNLEENGPGSLRDCAERDVPRVCVFRVSGTIRVTEPIMAGSNLYIAGQTAPGDGIQLRNDESTHGPLIVKDAEDVVIRFLKLRPGPAQKKSTTIDALTVENSSRVYLGNLSLMFATDETFAIHVSRSTARDITLADSILAYSLDDSNHGKGEHSKGALICSTEGEGNECGRISLIRNIFAHHRDRNPDVKATEIGPVEVVNNIFYDPISQFGEFYDLIGDTRIAYVGNLAMTGPSTNPRARSAVELFDRTEGNDIRVWASGNEARSCNGEASLPILDPVAEALQTEGPISLTVAPMPAAELLTNLATTAGDRLPDDTHRDRLDQQIITDITECRGKVIDRPDQVGGWPDILPSSAKPDGDGDLLPDRYEAIQPELDPRIPTDPWADADGDGLSNLESWLAELAGDRRA